MKGIEELTVEMLEELDLPGDFPIGFSVREIKGPKFVPFDPPIVGYVYTDPEKNLVIKVYGNGLLPVSEGSFEASYVRALLRGVAEKLDIVRRKR